MNDTKINIFVCMFYCGSHIYRFAVVKWVEKTNVLKYERSLVPLPLTEPVVFYGPNGPGSFGGPGWPGWLPKTTRIIYINSFRWTSIKPVPAILPFLIGLNGGKFQVTINGPLNKPAFEIDSVAFVNKEILLFRNGYNSRKCFGFYIIREKMMKFGQIRNVKCLD